MVASLQVDSDGPAKNNEELERVLDDLVGLGYTPGNTHLQEVSGLFYKIGSDHQRFADDLSGRTSIIVHRALLYLNKDQSYCLDLRPQERRIEGLAMNPGEYSEILEVFKQHGWDASETMLD